MYKYLLRIIFRNLVKRKVFSLINISGLAVGMACAVLIMLWVQHECSYDRFHKNADRLYRVVFTNAQKEFHGYYQPGPLAEYLETSFPEIVQTTNFSDMQWKLSYGTQGFFCSGSYVDPAFFEMFTFPLVAGNARAVLDDPYSIVISEPLAQKMFGQSDPIGKTLRLNDETDLNITGVFEEIPKTSHIQFDFVMPYEIAPAWMKMWDRKCVQTYVLVRDDCPLNEINQKIYGVMNEHNPTWENVLYLYPMTKSHLYTLGGGGLITYITIFSILAILILMVACINFMNLSTAYTEKRLTDPIGKNLSTWFGKKGKIVGVIRDFHTQSLRDEMAPIVLLPTETANFLCVRIQPDEISSTIPFIERTVKRVVPDDPFEYKFLDKEIDNLFKTELLTGNLATFIALLAIFISCLGLYGLASFSAQQRTKEIGVRKVLGASVPDILAMLTRDFIKWIILANLIAWPIAWYAMNKWLQNFAYRIDIDWWIFASAGGIALTIALLTVSWQVIRAATANPVQTLRYE